MIAAPATGPTMTRTFSGAKKKRGVFFFAFLLSFIFIFYSDIDHQAVRVSADTEASIVNVSSPLSGENVFTLDSMPVDNKIQIDVQFSIPVVASGEPKLRLAFDGVSDIFAVYDSSADADDQDTTLTFTYTVEQTHVTADLSYDGTDALVLDGGSITDISVAVPPVPTPANLTLPAINAANSLAGNENIVIDTKAPVAEFSTAFGGVTNANPFLVNLSFDETPVDFVIDEDLVITGGTLATTPELIGNTYALSVVPSVATAESLAIEFSIAAGSFSDELGNANDAETLTVTFDAVAPFVEIVGHIASYTNTTTPSFAFESDEAGTIEFVSGACASSTLATAGTTLAVMDALAEGTYDDCAFAIVDSAGNASATVSLASFVVDTTASTLAFAFGEDGDVTHANDAILVTVTFSEEPRITAPTDIVINEVAWMGYDGDSQNEWIELYNRGAEAIDLSGWSIQAFDGEPDIALEGIIPAYGYFLLERTDDSSVPEAEADQIYTGGMTNSGEVLVLLDDTGRIIDSINAASAWPAGDTSASGGTMQWNGDLWITFAGTPKTLNDGATAATPATDGIWNVSDITVLNGLIVDGTFTNDTENPRIYRFLVEPIAEGAVTVSVADGVFADLATNPSDEAFEASFIYDITAPVVSVDPLHVFPALWNEDTISFEFSVLEASDEGIASSENCPIAVGSVENGSNTIELGPFDDGIYEGCTVVITDIAGNESLSFEIPGFSVDTTAPAATITFSVGEFTNQEAFTATVSLSEVATGFDVSDISVIGSGEIVLDSFAQTADPLVYTVAIRVLAEGTITLTIGEESFIDAAGNENEESFTASIEHDTTVPELSLLTSVPALVNTATPSLTVRSNEDGAVSFTEGSACSIVDGAVVADEDAVLTLAALLDGTHECAMIVTDRAGNASEAVTLAQFVVDTTAPVALLETPDTTVNSTFAVTLTLALDTDRTTFETGSIEVENGSIADGGVQVDPGNAYVFTFTVTPTAEGNVTIRIPAGSFADIATNESTLSELVVSYELGIPVITLVTPIPELTNNNTPSFTISATEAGTVSFTGGCASTSTVGGAGNALVTLSTTADGTYDCSVRLTDAHGNASELVALPQFVIDATAPVPGVSAEDYSVNGAFMATVSWSEIVFGFDESDVVVVNGTIVSGTFAANPDGLSYSFTVVPSAEGTVTVRIDAPRATDAAGNANVSGAISAITYDATAPVAALVFGVAPIITSGIPEIRIASNEAGTLVFAGSCTDETYSVFAAERTIQFAGLADGTYGDCVFFVVDNAENESAHIAIPSFIYDTASPSVTSVRASQNGSYQYTEERIIILVSFSERVTVDGVLSLALSTGAQAQYESGSGTDTLRFIYVTAMHERSADLDYASADALVLDDGGLIRDAAGNNALLSLPLPGAPGSLSHESNVSLDIQGAKSRIIGGGSVGNGNPFPGGDDDGTEESETLADRIRDFLRNFDTLVEIVESDPSIPPVTIPGTETPVVPGTDAPVPANESRGETEARRDEVFDRVRERVLTPLLSENNKQRSIRDVFSSVFSSSVEPDDTLADGIESGNKEGSTQSASVIDALSSTRDLPARIAEDFRTFRDRAKAFFARVLVFVGDLVSFDR